MAKYIHTPEDRKFGNEEDLKFLIRHLGHDTGNQIQSLFINFNNFEKGKREPESLRQTEIYFEHLDEIYRSIRNLPLEMYFEESKFGTISLLEELSKLSPQYQTINLQKNEILIKNKEPIIYLQVYNFLKNAGGHAFRNSKLPIEERLITLGIELFPISDDELKYLGRNSKFYQEGNEFVRAYVKDNGCGIPEGNLENIFRRKSSTSEHGVGLSLIDWVCDSIHGFTSVESEVGKGSEFSLYFVRERK